MNKTKEPGIAYAIYEKVKDLPTAEQAEVLNYVDYVVYKSQQEREEWMALSVAAALRGMEDDVWPDYTAEDLVEDRTCPDKECRHPAIS